jgi:hypothetical protein
VVWLLVSARLFRRCIPASGLARRLAMLLLAATITGCAALPRTPFTAEEQEKAIIPGLPAVRAWADAPEALFEVNEAAASRQRPSGPRTTFSYLALSGGGGEGAYGAGVLSGWTATGNRPEFTIVSGVSTGALIAPFAFLGSRYDGVLRELYSGGYAEVLVQPANPLAALFGSGLSGNERLRALVAQFTDERLLADIAAEHAKGRKLLVITTNLDAQRGVIWNLGAVAASDVPDKLALFRDVLVASASVPALFPPMLIDAEADGHRFQEMHVDGTVTDPVYTLPEEILVRSIGRRTGVAKPNFYVLVNNRIEPSFRLIESRTLDIAVRTFSTAVKEQERSIVLATHEFARDKGIGFNLSYIDKAIPEDGATGFDTAYMRGLYEYGYRKARSGHAWEATPPDARIAAAVVAGQR